MADSVEIEEPTAQNDQNDTIQTKNVESCLPDIAPVHEVNDPNEVIQFEVVHFAPAEPSVPDTYPHGEFSEYPTKDFGVYQ